MFIYSGFNDGGAAGIAGEAMRTGQIVFTNVNADGKLVGMKTTASGDAAKSLAIVHRDETESMWNRGGVVSASLSSMEIEEVAVGDKVTFLNGFVRGMTNEVADGTYGPGMRLTIDWANAQFTRATGGDVVYATVALHQKAVQITSRNDEISIEASLPPIR